MLIDKFMSTFHFSEVPALAVASDLKTIAAIHLQVRNHALSD
ncbi:MAG TPA: hypothetical protein VGD65_08110 [Chryseosolibacter sp.]